MNRVRWAVRLAVVLVVAVLTFLGHLDVVHVYLLGALAGMATSLRGFYRSAYALGVTDAVARSARERRYALTAVRRHATALVISTGFAVAGLAALAFRLDPGPALGQVANNLLQAGIVGAVWLIALAADIEDEANERLQEGK